MMQVTIQVFKDNCFNLFTVLKKLKEYVGFFFFNNLIATNFKLISKSYYILWIKVKKFYTKKI